MQQQGSRDRGFTLVEVVVVAGILIVLAAIAIPVFLHHRQRAVDAAIKSDLRSVATAQETAFDDDHAYFSSLPSGVRLSQGNSVSITVASDAAANAYCLVGSNAGASQDWVYISDAGGLQGAGVTACPSTF